MKIVINRRHGGLGVSYAALKALEKAAPELVRFDAKEYFGEERDSEYTKKYGLEASRKRWLERDQDKPVSSFETVFSDDGEHVLSDINLRENRTHPAFVTIVETMGELADSPYSSLRVVDVPDDVEWTVEEYDGMEWVAEKHRTWA